MSDKNKLREELKAEAGKAIDALSLDDLEMVAGGTDGERVCPYCGKKFAVGGNASAISYYLHLAIHVAPVTDDKA